MIASAARGWRSCARCSRRRRRASSSCRSGTSRSASTRSSAPSPTTSAPRPTTPSGAAAGSTPTTSTPTTSASRPSTASWPPATSTRWTSPTSSASRRDDDGAGRVRARHGAVPGARCASPASTQSFEVTDAVLEKIGAQLSLTRCMEAGTIYRHVVAAKGEGNFIARGLHRRGDRAAAAVRAVLHPGGARAREDPGADDRAQVLGQVPEGDRLRRRRRRLRARVRRRPGGRQARHLGVRPAAVAEDQRPHRQRQVLALPDHPPGAQEARRRAAPQDRRHHLARGGDRRGALRPDGPGGRQEDLHRRRCRATTSSCKPYATVVEIDRAKLPTAADGRRAGPPTTSSAACATTRRTPPTTSTCASSSTSPSASPPRWAPSGRGALDAAREVAGRCVTENLFDRHIRPLFLS